MILVRKHLPLFYSVRKFGEFFLPGLERFGTMTVWWVGVFLSLLSPSAPWPTFFLCNGELPSYKDCDVAAIVVESDLSVLVSAVFFGNLGRG